MNARLLAAVKREAEEGGPMAVRKIEPFEPVTVGPYCGSIN